MVDNIAFGAGESGAEFASEGAPGYVGAVNGATKTWAMRVLNLCLWLSGSAVLSTGLILAFRLPPGSRGGRGLELLGWDRHTWGDLHTWLAYGLILAVLVHVALHARWLWVVACRRSVWRLLAGLGLGVALPVAALLWPVQRRGARPAESGERAPAVAAHPVR